MEDNGIIALFFSRAESAIQEVHEKYGHFCYKIAWNILENREDSEENGTGEENIQRVELKFPVNEAPKGESKILYAQDSNAVAGIIVRSITVNETATGTMLEFDDEITDETIFSYVKKAEVREVTWKEGGGWVDDGQGKLHSMPWRVEGTVGDTLTVDYYNWDDEIIGTLVFKLP